VNDATSDEFEPGGGTCDCDECVAVRGAFAHGRATERAHIVKWLRSMREGPQETATTRAAISVFQWVAHTLEEKRELIHER